MPNRHLMYLMLLILTATLPLTAVERKNKFQQFYCTWCESTYVNWRAYDIRRHMQIHIPYLCCKICKSQKCLPEAALNNHLKKEHKIQKNFFKHMKTHETEKQKCLDEMDYVIVEQDSVLPQLTPSKRSSHEIVSDEDAIELLKFLAESKN